MRSQVIASESMFEGFLSLLRNDNIADDNMAIRILNDNILYNAPPSVYEAVLTKYRVTHNRNIKIEILRGVERAIRAGNSHARNTRYILRFNGLDIRVLANALVESGAGDSLGEERMTVVDEDNFLEPNSIFTMGKVFVPSDTEKGKQFIERYENRYNAVVFDSKKYTCFDGENVFFSDDHPGDEYVDVSDRKGYDSVLVTTRGEFDELMAGYYEKGWRHKYGDGALECTSPTEGGYYVKFGDSFDYSNESGDETYSVQEALKIIYQNV